MKDTHFDRPTLGPFMSVICFRYLHDDTLDLAGQALIVDAGRQRGNDLIHELGLAGSQHDADAIRDDLNGALGLDGTRLCLIDTVIAKENGGFEIHSKECAAQTYTLGVLMGAISAITGKTMIGKEEGVCNHGKVVYHIDPF